MVSPITLRPSEARDRLVGGVRGERRHRAARAGRAFGLRLRDLVERKAACKADAVEHAVARAMRDVGRAVGPAQLGRLRDRDQQRGFAEREPPRLLAEIGERGGAHAFEVAAIGREREDRATRISSLLSARSSWIARTAWRSLAPNVRSVRGSSRRATCMVMVEPPDTMRPLLTSCQRRARRPRADRRRDGCGSACPRRRSACRR